MKKIVSAAGMAALGVVGLHAAAGDGLTRMESSKPWSLKANLRGFYDDNVFTTPRDGFRSVFSDADGNNVQTKDAQGNPIFKKDSDGNQVPVYETQTTKAVSSYGLEVRPSANFNLVTDQSHLSLGYEYGYRWYEDRPGRSADQSHIFNFSLTHDIDSKTSFSLANTFTLAQEPEVVDSATFRKAASESAQGATFRNNLDAVSNLASVSLNRQLNETLSAHLGYSFDLYEYDDDGYSGSFSSRLDRNKHQINLHLAAQIAEPTTALLGYQFKNVEFTSRDDLGFLNYYDSDGLQQTYGPIDANSRNSDTHVVFVGADHSFSPMLRASARLGAQFVSYNKLPNDHPYDPDDSQSNPYADINASFDYAEGSSVSLGVRHERNQTDLALITGGQALDQESTSIYASVNHRITSKISASAVGLYSMNRFDDSAQDLGDDDFLSLGLNANYMINQYLSAELGYNFDDLDSSLRDEDGNDIRGFSRNRVYLGLRAIY